MEQSDNKTADKTTYMREYKRKQYKEKGEQIRQKNKAYYYKYKFNLSKEEMKKYDVLLPYIAKLRKILDELKEANIELTKEFLEDYKEKI
jgi:hypothetical protein